MLLFLWVADLSFIAADVVFNDLGYYPFSKVEIHRDGSAPEFYQYLKLGWAMMTLGLIAWTARTLRPLVWVPVVGFLMATDAARLHERLGWAWAKRWDLPAMGGLQGGDVGEVLVASLVIVPAIVLLAAQWPRQKPHHRRFHLTVVAFMVLLGCFGVGLDIAHSLTRSANPTLAMVLDVIEDGGEMLTISALLAYLVASAWSAMSIGLRERAIT